MSKLKNIIKQLSTDDYEHIFNSLMDSEATKSAYLLKHLREKRLTDKNIMLELDVNVNAFYTLRSRLNQKIEEFLLKQMQSPRTDLLKKVANVNEIVFTKKRAIAVATLKKLEKELLDYDLSNELTQVYKSLKKLHINTAEYFHYSQLYNKHVAFNLAVDKAEEMLADYFHKYGTYVLTNEESVKFELEAILTEMGNVSKLYKSHRLYVYKSCITIFHSLMVENNEDSSDEEPIEDIITKVEKIFDTYYLDSTYYHIKIVFEYLKLLYYDHYKVYKKSEIHFNEIKSKAGVLLTNYNLFTFPSHFYIIKMERYLRMNREDRMFHDSKREIEEVEPNFDDISNTLVYYQFVALSCYYAGRHAQGVEYLNEVLQKLNLKKYPKAYLETRLLAVFLGRFSESKKSLDQSISSIQRLIRLAGKDECTHSVVFIKILKASMNDKLEFPAKLKKIKTNIEKLQKVDIPQYSPIKYIKFDQHFVSNLMENM